MAVHIYPETRGCGCPGTLPGWPLLRANCTTDHDQTGGNLHWVGSRWTPCPETAPGRLALDDMTTTPLTDEQAAAWAAAASAEAATRAPDEWVTYIVRLERQKVTQALQEVDDITQALDRAHRRVEVARHQAAIVELGLTDPQVAEVAYRIHFDWVGSTEQLIMTARTIIA